MQPVIYDVADSADGFIAGPSDDVSLFPHKGPVVDDYRERLLTYECCIMGRRTYEFAYAFGLEPGQNPYPAMRTIVLSTSLALPSNSDVEVVSNDIVAHINTLQHSSSRPVYLCGGRDLAGWLLRQNAIDRLRLKRAPIFLGEGTRLFGGNTRSLMPDVVSTKPHDGGIVFQEFKLKHE